MDEQNSFAVIGSIDVVVNNLGVFQTQGKRQLHQSAIGTEFGQILIRLSVCRISLTAQYIHQVISRKTALTQ